MMQKPELTSFEEMKETVLLLLERDTRFLLSTERHAVGRERASVIELFEKLKRKYGSFSSVNIIVLINK